MSKAKLFAKFALAAALVAPASGCKGKDVLKAFVERDVKVSVRNGVGEGSLDFTNTQRYTDYRQACEREVCGTSYRRECDYQRVCRQQPPVCSAPRRVCTPGGPSHSPVCHTDPRTGRRVCRGGGGHQPPVCHVVPGRCVPGPVVCGTSSVPRACWDVPVPRYCDTNCRQVPFRASRDSVTRSPITVRFIGEGSKELEIKVKELHVGVKTNERFQDALRNPGRLPKDAAKLFASLKPTDRTVVVLEAKGYELVPGQDFLRLTPDFRPGDSIVLELQVRRASKKKNVISAVGSESDLPELRTVEELP